MRSTGTAPDLDRRVPTESFAKSMIGLLYAGILFLVIVGGIYAGIFTATEAGAAGAFVALVLVIVNARFNAMPLRPLLAASLRETTNVTAMIFLLLIGGTVFTFFIATANVPATITEGVAHLSLSPKVVVALFLVVLLVLGMFLDGMSILLLAIPIAAPIVADFGFEGVWFGVLAVKMVEIGLITPPVGINVFIISGMFEDLAVEDVFKAVAPFVMLDLAVTAVFFAFPGLIMWLPNLVG